MIWYLRINYYCFFFFIAFRITGDTVLHAQMVVETLGGRENPGSHDGSGRGYLHGRGEEAEEKDSARLSVGEPEVPQLVDLQILPVRGDGVVERRR